ncbi:hypothetical protein TNCV_2889251 [Trichonephila clavipes]|nr:hypothetical protein TNCV_2889251 [Trichonephila clavipes]
MAVSDKRATSKPIERTIAASPLVRLVEDEERWEAPDHHQGVLPQNWGGTEQNRTITCMVLKAKANNRSKNLALRRVDLDMMLLSIRWHKQQQQQRLHLNFERNM